MHRNLSKRYFFTIYLLCSFFLIIAIVITHQIGSEVVIEQIHLNNLARLEQASAAFDALHQSTIPSMVQLLENTQIQRLIYSSQENNNQLVSQMQMLTQAKLSNPIIESILA